MAEYIVGIADDSVKDIDRLHREYAVNGMIVRCKDCEFRDAGEYEIDAWGRCRLHRFNTDDDKFCSWGVKRND